LFFPQLTRNAQETTMSQLLDLSTLSDEHAVALHTLFNALPKKQYLSLPADTMRLTLHGPIDNLSSIEQQLKSDTGLKVHPWNTRVYELEHPAHILDGTTEVFMLRLPRKMGYADWRKYVDSFGCIELSLQEQIKLNRDNPDLCRTHPNFCEVPDLSSFCYVAWNHDDGVRHAGVGRSSGGWDDYWSVPVCLKTAL
jgi:hypothetical protein